jgi:hemolysin activation/secretion protein
MMKPAGAIISILALSLPLQSVFAQQFNAPPLQLSPLTNRLATAPRALVREFRFEGNTVFSREELARVTSAFVGRELTREELDDARRAVSLHYAERGYINSGAVLPDQQVRGGIVTMRIVEGALSQIELTGNHWLRRDYLEGRVQRWAGRPLDLNKLREGLQLLRQNPNIEQVNAALRPGAVPGESILDLRVTDQQPFRLGLQADNYRPPSVDSVEFLLLAADRNLTGHSDPLELTYGIAQGGSEEFRFSDFRNVSGSYAVPITREDTMLRVFGSHNDYTIIEQPFAQLDIASQSYRYGVMLRQPVYQTASRELALAVSFERRHSFTELLGHPFDFPDSGSVLRLSQEWVDRTLNQVVAFRSTINISLDVFHTTDNGTDRDGKFVSWLGQFQYVRRLFNTPNQILFRTDAQWTEDPLVTLEQFSVGGAATVRGYRENQLVRDRGVVSSIEGRIPVVVNRLGAPLLQLAPFFDFGAVGHVGSGPAPREPSEISSAGIGLLFSPNRHVNASLYWGHPFRKFDSSGDDPQDLGLHFRVTANAF